MSERPKSSEDLARLSERFRAPLIQYFLRHGYPLDVAEDCTQDVFVRVLHSRQSAINNLQGYLFTVAATVAIDHRRKLRTHEAAKHDSITNIEIESREASPAHVIENWEDIERLDKILGELKPKAREIFLLNRLDGLSYTQLAARYGLSVAAIEKQMSKVLAHLRKRFSKDD